jgi:hypothetical protein
MVASRNHWMRFLLRALPCFENKVRIIVSNPSGMRGAYIEAAASSEAVYRFEEMVEVVVAVNPPRFHRRSTGLGKCPRVSLRRRDNDLSVRFHFEVHLKRRGGCRGKALRVGIVKGSAATEGQVPTARPRISSEETGLVMRPITETAGSISREEPPGNSNATCTGKSAFRHHHL